jgi:hypothetical protein
MVIVDLRGGLGNQLFEYAAGRHVALVNRQPLKLDTVTGFQGDFYRRSYALGPFNTLQAFADARDLQRAWTPKPHYRIGKVMHAIRRVVPERFARSIPAYGSQVFTEEKQFVFDRRLLEPTPNHILLRGYWQNEKYFEAIGAAIRREFTLSKPLSPLAQGYIRQIRMVPSVALHVRQVFAMVEGRPNPEGFKVHGTLPWDYYRQAITLVEALAKDLHFFVFADDWEWAAAHVRVPGQVTMVTGNRDYEDLILMSACQHQIMANSSFSWWAAWLNGNPEKRVVAPKAFMADTSYDTSDLYPAGWMRI